MFAHVDFLQASLGPNLVDASRAVLQVEFVLLQARICIPWYGILGCQEQALRRIEPRHELLVELLVAAGKAWPNGQLHVLAQRRSVWYVDHMKRTSTTLDRLVDPVVNTFTPEVAKALVRLRADPQLQARMDELAEKCNEGQLTPEEREEYETSVRFANYLAIIQAKARRLLRASGHG
jgi:hypothetical protein